MRKYLVNYRAAYNPCCDFSAFEQEIYDQGFRNAIYFMLWNPSERSCSNCEYRYSRELCGEEYCGQKYWSPKLEE